MDHLAGSIHWCVLQVSTLALVGVIASIVGAWRRPAAACSVACAAVVVSGLLTLAAPLSVHRLFVLNWSDESAPPALRNHIGSQGKAASVPVRDAQAESSKPIINLGQLTTILRSVASQVELPARGGSGGIKAMAGCFLLAGAFGLARFGGGMIFVFQTRREGSLIHSQRLWRLASELSSELDCARLPIISQSDRVTGAAVAGWWRPMLVLPRGWDRWSEEELRAVIAHELAHVARRDSLWRTIASGVTAMHFYNPIVHWLLRRTMLYQELAADELAARVVGRRCYLRSLSKLAIGRDNWIRCNTRSDLMPVYSGDLKRRINMLRSMEGTPDARDSRKQSLNRLVGSAAIIALGVAVVAVRGFAQPPATASEEAGKRATPVAAARSSATETPSNVDGIFGRKPLDPAIIAANDDGMLVIRVGELIQRPELQPFLPAINRSLPALLDSEIPGAGLSSVNLEAIDWIAGPVNVTIQSADRAAGRQGLVSFGADGLVVKLRAPFRLDTWVKRHAPEAQQHLVEGQQVFQLPILPALGPAPVWLTMADSATLLIKGKTIEITSETRIRDIFQASLSAGSTNESGWVPAWHRIDGGLASVVFTDAKIDDADNQELEKAADELGRAAVAVLRTLRQQCRQFACGVDAEAGGPDFGIRFRLTLASHRLAEKTAGEIRELIEVAARQLSDSSAKSASGSADRAAGQSGTALLVELMQRASIVTEQHEEGSADIVISAAIPLDDVVGVCAQAAAEAFSVQVAGQDKSLKR